MPQGDFRTINVSSAKTIGAAGKTTTEFDIPAENYLQGLQIRIVNTNGSTSNNADGTTGETIEGTTDDIEVVADGVSIFKTTGLMARTIEAFDAGHLISADETMDASDVQHADFPINFGRGYSDRELIFPAHMADRITLKITTTYTDSTTIGWTTSSSNAKIDVQRRILVSNQVVNSPYLRKYEQSSNTFTTVQVETIKLPVGAGIGAYRRIFIYAREAAIQDGVDLDKFDLLVNDKTFLYKAALWNSVQGENDRRYGVRSEKHLIAFLKDNDTFLTRITNIKAVQCTGAKTGVAGDPGISNAEVDVIAGDKVTIAFFASGDMGADGAAVSSAEAFYMSVYGEGMSNCVALDFGTEDISQSLQVGQGTGITSLKLDLNIAAAGALVKVVTEEITTFKGVGVTGRSRALR